jgi:hypothetical protein
MDASFEKRAGLSLIIFTLLILLTMVLHPAAGNFQHLLVITPMILVTHGAAILSLPFAAIGFWGLTRRLGADDFLSLTAFAMASLALVAALLAATTNGLVLPIFIHQYRDATPDIVDTLRPELTYSFAVNAAFDYVYTGAFCLAILGWSAGILHTKRLPRWIAWWGILVAIAGVVIVIAGASPASLLGFRLFVAGLVSWTIFVGVALRQKWDA